MSRATPKITVLAQMPSASVKTAAIERSGCLDNSRSERRKSSEKERIPESDDDAEITSYLNPIVGGKFPSPSSATHACRRVVDQLESSAIEQARELLALPLGA